MAGEPAVGADGIPLVNADGTPMLCKAGGGCCGEELLTCADFNSYMSGLGNRQMAVSLQVVATSGDPVCENSVRRARCSALSGDFILDLVLQDTNKYRWSFTVLDPFDCVFIGTIFYNPITVEINCNPQGSDPSRVTRHIHYWHGGFGSASQGNITWSAPTLTMPFDPVLLLASPLQEQNSIGAFLCEGGNNSAYAIL